MNYKDSIILGYAKHACKKVSGKVIRSLQKMTREAMQSGDDSGLKNVWDEVCVQVQFEESVMWDVYLDTIRWLIEDEVKSLDNETKQAIWLQTTEGENWEMDNEEDDTLSYYENDIIDHILYDFVISTAANWTNKRIEKYLEREYD